MTARHCDRWLGLMHRRGGRRLSALSFLLLQMVSRIAHRYRRDFPCCPQDNIRHRGHVTGITYILYMTGCYLTGMCLYISLEVTLISHPLFDYLPLITFSAWKHEFFDSPPGSSLDRFPKNK